MLNHFHTVCKISACCWLVGVGTWPERFLTDQLFQITFGELPSAHNGLCTQKCTIVTKILILCMTMAAKKYPLEIGSSSRYEENISNPAKGYPVPIHRYVRILGSATTLVAVFLRIPAAWRIRYGRYLKWCQTVLALGLLLGWRGLLLGQLGKLPERPKHST